MEGCSRRSQQRQWVGERARGNDAGEYERERASAVTRRQPLQWHRVHGWDICSRAHGRGLDGVVCDVIGEGGRGVWAAHQVASKRELCGVCIRTSERRIMPSMSLYSESVTYAPISAMERTLTITTSSTCDAPPPSAPCHPHHQKSSVGGLHRRAHACTAAIPSAHNTSPAHAQTCAMTVSVDDMANTWPE
jgi:hypothetical protein